MGRVTDPFDSPPQPGAGPASGGRSGLMATIAKHPYGWLFSALAVVFVLLGTGSVFAGIAVGSTRASAATPHSSRTPTPKPTVRATPSALPTPSRLRTCSIAAAASNASLATFEGTVMNATTGEVLFDRNGSTASPPGSVIKTITAAAGLAVLGPDYQFTTNVYAGSAPGSVVLVGGGDPTLSAVASSVYSGAPKLSDLAAQVAAAWKAGDADTPISSVVLDATMWNPADNWDPSWPRSEQTQGFQPEITALMVDGDRANPRAQTSPRSTDPVGNAGKAFVQALQAAQVADGDVTVSDGAAEAGRTLLGTVKSQPLKVLIGQMLPNSDNTLAEMIARVTSKVAGRDGSSASLNAVIPNALNAYGLPTTGMIVKDGSGESNLDGIPSSLVAALMAKVAAGGQNLNVIAQALPIAGKTGTLAGRFTGANAVARGAVIAKTGTIARVNALGGIIHAKDGSTLSFAFYALGAVNGRTLSALDTVTTAAFACGNNLSNV